MTQLLKDQMNAGIFGKFGQKINEKTEMYHIDDVYADTIGHVFVIRNNRKKLLTNYTERGGYVYNKILCPRRIPVFIFPILSSYTTALARIKLWRVMQKYPKDIIYSDTDSVFMMKNHFGDSERLGELESLGVMYDAIFVRPKQYYLNTKEKEIIKTKGIPKKFVQTKKDFLDLLDGKSVTIERFTKTKESAIRKLPYGSIITMTKNTSVEDDKRIWDKPFSFTTSQDSHPLVL